MQKLILFILFCAPLCVVAQERYQSEVFSDYKATYDIQYGESKTQSGVKMKLKMDVYEPQGDSLQKRPVVILAHGGYFFFGGKENFAVECIQLAKAGYVAVSINYRLIDVVDDSFFVAKRAVIDAVGDMKAAVRYFYQDADTKNLWQIDTANIFIGGYSAGAITSLHYAYANSAEDVQLMGSEQMLKYVLSQGGLEGKSGNPGYPTKVRGVINIAGSLFDAKLLDKNEAVLFSVHGDEDIIVPFETGLVGTTKVTTQGS